MSIKSIVLQIVLFYNTCLRFSTLMIINLIIEKKNQFLLFYYNYKNSCSVYFIIITSVNKLFLSNITVNKIYVYYLLKLNDSMKSLIIYKISFRPYL